MFQNKSRLQMFSLGANIAGVLLLALAGVGCKTLAKRESSGLLESRNKEYAIVTFNGRESCKILSMGGGKNPENLYTYQPARTLARQFEAKGIPADVLHICLYAADFGTTPENMRVIGVYRRNGQNGYIGDIGRKYMKDVPQLIQKFADGRQVILVGHSYGGWSAMYAAMKSDGLYQVKSLFTLDPISPKDCGALSFVAGDSSCKQFPSDMTPGEVRIRVGYWINFYQRQGKIASNLANGAMNSYHYLNNDECGHRYAGANREVWKIILKAAASDDIGSIQADLQPFSGEPQRGPGSCGAFTDSGTSWENPGDTSTAFWKPDSANASSDASDTPFRRAPVDAGARLESGKYKGIGEGACPYAKAEYLSSGNLSLTYSGSPFCDSIIGSFACTGGNCTGTLFEIISKNPLKLNDTPYASNYKLKINSKHAFTEQDESSYGLTDGGLVRDPASTPAPTLKKGSYRTSKEGFCAVSAEQEFPDKVMSLALYFKGGNGCDGLAASLVCSNQGRCDGRLYKWNGSQWVDNKAYSIQIDEGHMAYLDLDDEQIYRLHL